MANSTLCCPDDLMSIIICLTGTTARHSRVTTDAATPPYGDTSIPGRPDLRLRVPTVVWLSGQILPSSPARPHSLLATGSLSLSTVAVNRERGEHVAPAPCLPGFPVGSMAAACAVGETAHVCAVGEVRWGELVTASVFTTVKRHKWSNFKVVNGPLLSSFPFSFGIKRIHEGCNV